MSECVFTRDDFTAAAMAPFFTDKASAWELVADMGFVIEDVEGEGFFEPDTRFGFKDNGGDTLCVAHIDTVRAPTPPCIRGERLYSTGVDNRLGLYIALTLLAGKGIDCDVLVSDHEEMVMSSARFFVPPRGRVYNFGFGLDRRGEGAVLYHYFERGSEFNLALERCGLKVGVGTYSDVCELSGLGCRCLNLGVGYCDHHHDEDAYADLDVAVAQLNRFHGFWRKHHRRHFFHDRRDEFRFETLPL